jgi:hypothetical protein
MATTPLMAAAYQAMAQRNIAALEARAANVQCTAAFSNAPAAAPDDHFHPSRAAATAAIAAITVMTSTTP